MNEGLKKKKVLRSAICALCNKEEETVEHSLLFCEWTRAVWFGCQLQCVPNRLAVTSFHGWLGDRLKAFEVQPDFSVFASIALCCTLWSIWKGRNNAVFRGEKPKPLEVIHKANLLHMDYFSYWQKNNQRSPPRSVALSSNRNWSPPCQGSAKINTDASYNDFKKSARAGIIARNEFGDVITGLTKAFPAISPLMAEALSLREAMAFAGNLGISSIEIENDCLELIKACKGEINRGEIFNILKDIHHLKGSFQQIKFVWVPREANRVAHLIAYLASRNCLPLNWIWDPPLSLLAVINEDKASAARVGFPFDPGGSNTAAAL